MRNAGAMKGVMDGNKDGGGSGKAPQAKAFRDRKEKEREDAIRKGELSRSLLDKGDRA